MKNTKKLLVVAIALLLIVSVSLAFAACDKHDCAKDGHVDENTDYKCDICGEILDHTCVDANNDGKCDICGEDVAPAHDCATEGHVDANEDGLCDVCGFDSYLKDAKDYLNGLYKEEVTDTPTDYDRLVKVRVGTVIYDVVWTVDVTDGVTVGTEVTDGKIIIDVNDVSDKDIAYVLTATITGRDGEIETLTYNRKVPAYKVATWEEYKQAADDKSTDSLNVVGYVVGVNAAPLSSSKGSLWLMDAEGHGYYVYAPSLDDEIVKSRESINAAFPIGTEVKVSGTVTLYGGAYEFNKGATVQKTGATAADKNVDLPYTDVTALFGAAADMKDASLVVTQGTRVTIKDALLLDKTDGKNYYFSVNGVEYICYIDIYLMDDEDKAALANKWVGGKKANLTGIVNAYSGNHQLYPDSLNSIEISTTALTDAEKLAAEISKLDIPTEVTEDSQIDLPATGTDYPEVTFENWASDAANAVVANGKLTITLADDAVKANITVTAKCGDASQDLSFEIAISAGVVDWKDASWAVTEAAKYPQPAKSDYYYIYGVVEDDPTADYCNFNLTDGTSSIKVYGLYTTDGTQRYGSKRDIAELPIAKGDTVYLMAKLQDYNGTLELVDARLQEAPAKGTSVNPYNASEAVVEAAKYPQPAKSEFAYVSGTVSDEPTADYCNFNLGDGTSTIKVYGLYTADGTQRYGSKRDIAELPVAQGDTVLLMAKFQDYNGTLELVDARLISVTAGGGTVEPEPEKNPEHAGTLEDPYTVADANIVAGKLASGAYTDTMVYTKGIIKSIGNKGSYLSNIVLVDEAGATVTFLCYSCNYTDTVTAVSVNDTVIIYGAYKNYNGTLEITNVKDGSTTIHAYPTFAAVTRGTSTVAVDAKSSADAAVTLSAESGENGSTFTFTVAYDDTAVQIVSVKVNGVVVEAVEGTYTGTIDGNMTVLVETAEAGAVLPTLAASISFADTAIRTEQTTSKQVWVSNGITFTNEGSVADYSNPVRCYKNSTITIDYTGMIKVVIHCNTAAYATELAKSTVAGATVAVADKDVTITFTAAVDTCAISALANQVRIDSIDVYTVPATPAE